MPGLRFRNKSRAPLGSSNSDTAQSSYAASNSGDHSPPTRAATTADILSSEYAQKRRELMELTSYLRTVGAETIIDLPRIVVIGGQSAGKSSLVEAVTGINVPRDSGTCTRCPMECTITSTSSTWSCKVSLQYVYDPDTGEPLAVSRSVPFGPGQITDKSEVEIWLRRAQVAILSPGFDTAIFLSKSVEELRTFMRDEKDRMKKFEKNKICVDIQDPDATDLAFVDLPGLIQNESQETIDLVRNLVEFNILGDNTIILVTIPISDDMENQQSVLLARQADPDGERTIGVLTKPDTLTPGATSARRKWKDILEGREHPLTHGYYCVRLPDDDERARSISRAEAERNAKNYLDSTAPWSEIPDRRRFGVQNLITNASKLLMVVIEKALPKIEKEIKKLLADTNKELSALPAALISSANATSEILLRVSEFNDLVKKLVYGGGDDKTFIQHNRATYGDFMEKIKMSAPDFRPFTNWHKYRKPNWADFSGDESFTEEGGEKGKSLLHVEPIDLHGVRDVIKSSIDWHLPHHVPFEANAMLIKRSIEMWHHHVLNVFDEVYKRLESTLETLITKRFSQFKLLESLIRASVKKELNEIHKTAQRDVLKALKLEQSPYFTQNDHYLNSTRAKWFLSYTKARMQASSYLKHTSHPSHPELSRVPYVSFSSSELERRVLADLATLGYTGLTLDALVRLHPTDEFEQELKLMADVRAYFQVAYKRFIDHIPLTIEHSLNQAFSDQLQLCLYRELDISNATEERMQNLLSEDPEIAARRKQLEIKKARLLDIQGRLSSFNVQ